MKTACTCLALVLLLLGEAVAIAANVSWTGAGDGSSYNDPANWSNNAVPGPNDSAVVNIGAVVLPTSGTLTAGHVTFNVAYTAPVAANQTLSITGSWVFNGPFTLTAGQQFAISGGGSVLVGGTATLSGASIDVTGSGTKVSFPSVTTYIQPAAVQVQWIADQSAELDFPNLTTITGSGTSTAFGNTSLDLTAQNSATLNLPALTGITEPTTAVQQYSTNGVQFTAINSGVITAAALASFSDATTSGSSLSANNGGMLVLPRLTAPFGIQMNLNSLSNPQQFTSVQGTTSFVLNGGTTVMHLRNITGLTYISSTGSGTQLSFPDVTTYTQPATTQVQWIADQSAELDFPNLTTITGSGTSIGFGNASLDLTAQNGATLNLPALTGITEPTTAVQQYSTNGVQFTATNSGVVTANALATFDDVSASGSSLNANNSGTLALALLTAPVGVQINVNAQSNPQNFTSLQGTTTFTLNSGTVAMTLSNISGLTYIGATGSGTQLSFPDVTTYTQPATTQVQWIADQSAELDFPHLTTITGSGTSIGFGNASLDLTAQNSATLNLPALTGITEPATAVQGYSTNGVQLTATNGGIVTANALATFTDVSSSGSFLDANNSGTLALAQLTSPDGVQINVNAASNPQVFISIQGNVAFTLNSGVVAMALTDLTGLTAITATGTGTDLSFPSVTSYTQPASTNVTWLATSDGELDFPALTTIHATTANGFSLSVTTSSGGLITDPALTTVTGNVNSNQAAPLLIGQSASFALTSAARAATPVPFSEKAAAFAVVGAANATPQKDGVPNLLKYLYDIDPGQSMTASDRAALPVVGTDTVTTPGTTYLTLTYRQYAGATGLAVALQTSSDLATWTSVTPDIEQQTGVDSTTGDPIMEVGVDITHTPRKFIRLNVALPSN